MSKTTVWLVILGGFLATYLIRLSFIVFVSGESLPSWFRRSLRYVPIAVLSAIVATETLKPGGVWALHWQNMRIYAILATGIVAWRWHKNAMIPIIVGLIVLWGLSRL